MRKLKSCFRKPQKPYINKHFIDDYIDEYWIMNCPKNYSVGEINASVWQLVHNLFIMGIEHKAHDHEEQEQTVPTPPTQQEIIEN